MGGEEAERWGFFNRLAAPDAVLAEAQKLATELADGPTFANAMTKRMLEMEWAMSVETGDRSGGGGAGALHGDRGLRARLPRLRRQAEAGVRGQLRWPGRIVRHPRAAVLRRRPPRASPRTLARWADATLPSLPHDDVDAACRARVKALGEAGFLKAVVPA